jgi:parallel beta-helix repeat protein
LRRKEKMKKILTVIIIGLLCLSTYSIFAPRLRAESEVLQLPAGAYYANHVQTYATILQNINVADQGQIATAAPGQTITIAYTMQIYCNMGPPPVPGEIRQAFFGYSWASSWPPWDAYTEVYNGIPGLYPGVTKSDSFTLQVPTSPGSYNVWFLGESQYSMQNAIAAHTSPPTTLPHAKIIVSTTNRPSPVGYWKFDEGSGNTAYDSSGNGNDGTLHTATWTAGKIGSALHFNGVDSWVEIPNSPTLTAMSQITLEAWIQEDSITAQLKGIISKCDGWAPPTSAEYFLGTNENGKVFFETDHSTAIFSAQTTPLITEAGRWYHVAGTWSGNSYVIYVNGQPVLSGTCTPQTTLSNSLPVQIGRHGTWSWVYFQGIIDEVKIYNYARTSDEIFGDYGMSPIYILADGSIDPSNAPIQRNGDLYTLTGDITSSQDGIVIERDNVVLDGADHTIRGTWNGQGSGTGSGTVLRGRSNVIIRNLNVENFFYGIFLSGSSGCSVSGNTGKNNAFGIRLENDCSGDSVFGNTETNNQYGITLVGSSEISVFGNVAINGAYYGILVGEGSSGNVVSGNNVANNDLCGIWLYDFCSSNVISGNSMTNNHGGIGFQRSSGNSVYHNNFIDNSFQVLHPAPGWESVNTWNEDYPSGGNYWSDYTGTDTNRDGIGDTPYIINANNQDNYPLMKPWSPTLPLDFEVSISPETRTVQVGDSVTCQVSLSPKNGFNSNVYLSLSGNPTDTLCTFNPQEIAPGQVSTLTITSSISTPLTSSTLTITGTGGDLVRSKTLTLQTMLLLEISVEKFYTKTDISHPFFQIKVGSGASAEWCRAPKKGSELGTSKAWQKYPGPMYVSSMPQPTFPLQVEVKAFSTDIFGTEQEIGTGVVIIEQASTLLTNTEFDLPSISMKVRVDILSVRGKIPDTYFPNGITKEQTPNLADEWYWFAVGADRVWNSYRDSDFKETIVAVLDTGVDYNHPALDDVIWVNQGEVGLDADGRDKATNGVDDDGNGYNDDWHGYDFVGTWGVHDNDPMDEAGHGTEVAGVIAAQAQTGFTAGVATVMRGRIKIMPVRVLDGVLGGLDLVEGIKYATKMKANIISMSLSRMGDFSSIYGVEAAINEAVKQGIVVVAAAGNDRSMAEFYPASYKSVMSVSGVKNATGYSGFWIYPGEGDGSNYGPSTQFNKGFSVEVCAPSDMIVTTSRGAGTNPLAGGTSMGAPIVAATAAMVMGYASQRYGRTLNPNEIRYILRESSIDLGPSKWDPYYGYGMVDAFAALQKVDELLGQKNWQIRLDPPTNLDLHVFDSLGRHVGLNYSAGELEMGIPGAIHTGDEDGGFETVFLPLNITDYKIELIGIDVNGSSPYTLQVIASNESGGVLNEWNLEGKITEDETQYFTMESTATGFMLYIDAYVDVNPDTLNLQSRGCWITAYVELPKSIGPSNINVSSIMLNGTVPVDLSGPATIADYDNDGLPDLMVKFDRAKVQRYILDNFPIEVKFMTAALTMTGRLNDGTLFQGTDTIRITFPGNYWKIICLEKLGIV